MSPGTRIGGRRPVEAGVEARGMKTSPRGGEVNMREVFALWKWFC